MIQRIFRPKLHAACNQLLQHATRCCNIQPVSACNLFLHATCNRFNLVKSSFNWAKIEFQYDISESKILEWFRILLNGIKIFLRIFGDFGISISTKVWLHLYRIYSIRLVFYTLQNHLRIHKLVLNLKNGIRSTSSRTIEIHSFHNVWKYGAFTFPVILEVR